MIDEWKASLREDIEAERGRCPAYREPRIYRFAVNLFKATFLAEEWQGGEGERPDADVPNPLVNRSFDSIEGEPGMEEPVYQIEESVVAITANRLMRENDSWMSRVLSLDTAPGEDSTTERAAKSLAEVASQAGHTAGPQGANPENEG